MCLFSFAQFAKVVKSLSDYCRRALVRSPALEYCVDALDKRDFGRCRRVIVRLLRLDADIDQGRYDYY
jgi:hypothetical protein